MNNTRPVLFELGTEELPPDSLQFFWSDLRDAAVLGLKTAGLVDEDLCLEEDIPRLYTARRLALMIPGVRSETKSEVVVRRGPALKVAFDEQGEPTKALLGFARGCGAGEEQIKRWRAGEDCERTEKGEWVKFAQTMPSRAVQKVLPDIFRQAVASMPLDVRMRWGTGDEEFTRPVRWVVLLYGKEVVPGSLMDLEFGKESRGHRFLNFGPFVIGSAQIYCDLLRQHKVLVLLKDRNDEIDKQIRRIEQKLQQECGTEVVVMRDGLIQEKILSSTEYPQAVVGSFDKRFLKFPEGIVTAVLEGQQQCFPVRERSEGGTILHHYRVAGHTVRTAQDRQGKLMPYFVAVANLPDKSGRIGIGYERVVQARLQDVEFYLQQDQQRSLESRVVDLEHVVFHRKLGTLADRTRRIEALSGFVAEMIVADKALTVRAAHLCKADLTTDMVQAFPHLQGTIGAYYAFHEGEDEVVRGAIATQYWHRPPPGLMVPPPGFSRPGLALALADRVDMLVGIFAAGDIPTGNRDPLGVRRAAYDVVYLMLAYDYVGQQALSAPEIEIDSILEKAADGYPEFPDIRKAISSVKEYLTGRLRSTAVESTPPYTHDEVEAVLAVPWRNSRSVFSRLDAVRDFRTTMESTALAEANKRIRNILRKSEAPDGGLDPELLREPAEQALAERVAALRPQVEKLCQERQYQQAMEQLATLAGPVAKFFDDVLVMAEEPELRHNRLRLLRDVRELFLTIADLSRLQGAPKAA